MDNLSQFVRRVVPNAFLTCHFNKQPIYLCIKTTQNDYFWAFCTWINLSMYKYISLFWKFNFAALEFPLTRSASRPTRFHLGRSQQRRLEVILWRFQVFLPSLKFAIGMISGIASLSFLTGDEPGGGETTETESKWDHHHDHWSSLTSSSSCPSQWSR